MLGSAAAVHASVDVSGSTALGTSARIDKSNQMVLGSTSVVETLLMGEVILSAGKSIQAKYKSEDGTQGITATKTFTTTEGSHTVNIKDGLIVSWDIV